MVILFTAPYLKKKGKKAGAGGLETYLFRVAGALKKMGHQPIIVSLGEEDIHYVENGIEFYFTSFPKVPVKGKISQMICRSIGWSLMINRKIKELMWERPIDVIQFTSLFGMASCYYGKTPAVMRLSSYAKTCYKDCEDVGRVELYISALFERIAARRCNAVFAPSYVVADAVSKDIHREVSVIESPFWNDSEMSDESLYYENLYGKKYFLFFGRLSFEKGILVIAEILERFLAKNPDYYFVCCGASGLIGGRNSVRILEKASGKYKDRFIYMKPIPHETLYPIIKHAEFVICPSIMENFSNACMEAMYLERVVIGTDGTSYEQMIDNGRSGLLCMPGDAESLLDKMFMAVEMDEQQKEDMGRNARKRIDKLAPEFTVNKLLRYYQYVIDNVKR